MRRFPSRTRSRVAPGAATLALGLALAAHAPRAAAQAADASQIAQAREQYQAGVVLGQAGDWERARTAFERAYALYPQPLTLLNLATAQVQTHRLVEGAESYRRFVLAATTEPALAYRAAAQAALDALDARVPHATLAVTDLRDDDALTLDDAPLSRESLGAARPLDPGPHALALLRRGVVVARVAFALAEGERRAVVLAAPRAPDAAVAPAAPRAPDVAVVALARPRPIVTAHPREGRARASVIASPWLWTAVGLVVVGAAAGAIVYGVTAPRRVVGNWLDGAAGVN